MSPPEKKTRKRAPKEQWRRYGAARRKELVAKDEVQGGLSFEMHKKCQIERYFRVAEKAMSDFQRKCHEADSSCSALEETYVVGHRLKAFLGKALPQHPNYKKSSVAQLRHKSQRNLDWIKSKMDELALKIDEEQLNTFITLDFEPEPDDLSTSSSEADDEASGFADFSSMGDIDDREWEDFTGWRFSGFPSQSLSDRDTPSAAETDSSRSHELSNEDSDSDEQPSDELVNLSDLPTDDEEEGDDDDRTVEDPQAFVTFQDEDDEESRRSELNDGGPSAFFRQIADETVCYESDSEAVDSWAQDGESHARSCASSGTAMTYDPARIAFREIMMNVPRDKLLKTQTRQSLPQPPLLPPKSILTLRRSESILSTSAIRQQQPRVPADS